MSTPGKYEERKEAQKRNTRLMELSRRSEKEKGGGRRPFIVERREKGEERGKGKRSKSNAVFPNGDKDKDEDKETETETIIKNET